MIYTKLILRSPKITSPQFGQSPNCKLSAKRTAVLRNQNSRFFLALIIIALAGLLAACGNATSPDPGGIDNEMVRVTGGTFQMGDNNSGYLEEYPEHSVTMSGFYIGKYEVTQAQYKAVMGNNPSYFKGNNLPVECVTWYDAVEFCNKLSEKKGLETVYTIDGPNVTVDFDKNGYRLPTEAEWEYAARGGNGSPGDYAYSGSNTIGDVAWYDENSDGKTHEVGKKAANGLGLYDMSGNVWEWCWDWYEDYSSEAQTNPVGAGSGTDRILRGGSWYHSEDSEWQSYSVGIAWRSYWTPSNRDSTIGFRLVRPL